MAKRTACLALCVDVARSCVENEGITMNTRRDVPAAPARQQSSAVEAFLAEARAIGRPGAGARGRLVFALDATLSRQPTWDIACDLQAAMFDAVGEGGLAVQLVYYRGVGEARASGWVERAQQLKRLMTRIDCRGGRTQIGRVLEHAESAGQRAPVAALVFIGDAMEENPDLLADAAARLALRGTRAFLFQEGADKAAARTFSEIARLTRGAHLPFDEGSAAGLADLLGSIAAFAGGGFAALEARGTPGARRLLADLGS
jgi:hypothetical protein